MLQRGCDENGKLYIGWSGQKIAARKEFDLESSNSLCSFEELNFIQIFAFSLVVDCMSRIKYRRTLGTIGTDMHSNIEEEKTMRETFSPLGLSY